MNITREFFQKVRKTILPRPAYFEERDILGQSGSAWAAQATIYGDNWYHDQAQNLIEIYDAGAAISFKNILPNKNKYAKEGLYLRLGIAYRTTEKANVNIRTFSGNHVMLPNSLHGGIYYDPFTCYYVTDDLTLNINSIFYGEKLWLQRVDWEWVSKEVIYEDELHYKDPYLTRSQTEVASIYAEKEITVASVKEYLANRIRDDEQFAKRCLALLNSDRLMEKDLPTLYADLGMAGVIKKRKKTKIKKETQESSEEITA